MPRRRDPDPIETRTGIITGWRCWAVLPSEAVLRPIYMRGLIWKPGEPFEARCPEQIHPVPTEGCKCGIWAVCHPMMLDEASWGTAPPSGVDPLPGVIVIGQVALWGSVIEFQRGWRAQFGYPAHLYAFTDDELLAQTLRERYAVPVAWDAEADLLRAILPKSFKPPGRPAPRAPGIMPNVGLGGPTPAVAAMVQAQELQRLQQLRADAQTAQERLEHERQAQRDELEQRRAELKQVHEEIRLERQCLKADRQALDLARERQALEIQASGCSHFFAGRTTSQNVLQASRYLVVQSLREECRRRGVTQDAIAEAAGVSRPQVVNVFAGRAVSRNVIEAARRLIAERPAAPSTQEKAPPNDSTLAVRRLRKLRSAMAMYDVKQADVCKAVGRSPGLISQVFGNTRHNVRVERIAWELVRKARREERRQLEGAFPHEETSP